MKNNAIIFFLAIIAIVAHVIWITMTRWHLPDALIQRTMIIQGIIDSVPEKKFHGIQFQFHADAFNHHAINTHFLIAWYQHPPQIIVGQRWQFTVKLKPPVGLHNAGGFDYAANLLHRGITATGYVVTRDANNKLLGNSKAYFLDIFRQRIQLQINQVIHNPTLAAFISALCVGLRSGLTENDWQVFQKTGTNHLVAIAGLHIGFVASTVYALFYFLRRCWPRLLLIIPASRLASIAAILSALAYTALSGFAIPAQRASIMLFLGMTGKILYYRVSVWRRWCFAIVIILVWQPFDVSDASFWLSFVSIAMLGWVMGGRLALPKHLISWIKMQYAIIVGLMPLMLLFFQQISLVAFFTNAIAIPWIGFLILPIALLACVFSLCHGAWISNHLFAISGKLLSPLWIFLEWTAHQHFSSWHDAIASPLILVCAMCGVFFLLAPKGLPGKWIGCFGLLPLFFYYPPHPKLGEYTVTVMDVGQGLSVLVQTAHHVLLYDAGAHFPGGFDMGASVIAPYLRKQRISHIDRMEISHGDNDHSGGAAFIATHFRVDEVVTSDPALFHPLHAYGCVVGQTWVWDNVHFTTLNPTAGESYRDNNSSCVIKIESPYGSTLLTGDIEELSEYALINQWGDQLRSTVLVVPHHGSRTSSSERFIQAVSPRYAVISSGRYNRYHLPSSVVVSRYVQNGTTLFNTAKKGAIIIRFLRSGQVLLNAIVK